MKLISREDKKNALKRYSNKSSKGIILMVFAMNNL